MNMPAPLPKSRWDEMRPVTQEPRDAFFRSLIRAIVPGAAWFMDRPQAGYPTDMGNQLGGNLPFGLGQLWTAIASARRAKDLQGMMMYPEQLPGGEGGFGRFLSGLDPAMSYAPLPSAAKMAYAGGRGLMGAPGLFGTSWEQALPGAAGGAIRRFSEPMNFSLPWGEGTVPSSPSQWAGSNPATVSGVTPQPWAQAPAAWQPEPSQNPFANPETGFIPTWAR